MPGIFLQAVLCLLSFSCAAFPAFAGTADCEIIKSRFYSVRDVSGLLALPFGIKKPPEELTQNDYETIGRRVFECGNDALSFSAGAISSKMTSIRRHQRPLQRVERNAPNPGGKVDPIAPRRENHLAKFEEKNELRKSNQYLRRLKDTLAGRYGATRRGGLEQKDIDKVEDIARRYPELASLVEEIKTIQKIKEQDFKQFEQRQAAIANEKKEREDRVAALLKGAFGESGPSECVQAETTRKALGETALNDTVHRAAQLSLAGESADACRIISDVKGRFERVRTSLVACADVVRAMNDPMASEASSSILANVALVNFLRDQTLRPVDDVECR